jgi:L-rhamnose mutarotase
MHPKRQRFGKVVRLQSDRIATYVTLHESVWPGVVAALTLAGIRNFSIYRRHDLLFSYYEYVGDDYDADMAKIAADPISQRWVELIRPCLRSVDETDQPSAWIEMSEVFHVD